MKQKKDKIKIYVNLKRAMGAPILIICAGIFILLVPLIDKWDLSDLFWRIAFYFIISVTILAMIIILFLCYGTAEFSQDGIKFFTPIHPGTQKIKWEEIKEIRVKPKITFESTTGFKTKYNWIHICLTENVQIDDQFGEKAATKKVGLLHYIIYKPEKAKVLAEYCKQYRPDLDLTELLSKHSSSPKTKWGYWDGGIETRDSKKD